ncbi:MAG: hypothetical protein ACRD2U_17190 [Terriglobales bacterium]
MSSATVLDASFSYDVPTTKAIPPKENTDSLIWNTQRFGREQVRSMVHQIFFPGGAKAPRQVVFTGVDSGANVAEICLQAGHALCAQISGSVCIVEMPPRPSLCEDGCGDQQASFSEQFDCLRQSARALSKRLWRITPEIFLQNERELSVAWLRCRRDALRLDFDYTIFHAPPTGHSSDAALLGHLCDGVVLVLTANSTRRVTARKVKESLGAANARLLGTVLSDRQFPIPEGIYKRL